MKKTDDAIIDDIIGLFDAESGRRPSGLEAAIYLEDCLGIELTDDEIASLKKEDPEGIRRLAARKAAP